MRLLHVSRDRYVNRCISVIFACSAYNLLMLCKTGIASLLLSTCLLAFERGEEVLLWPQGAPGSEKMANAKEVVDGPHGTQDFTRVWSIHRPSLLVYLAPKEKATGAAMIIAPGGGHRFLSLDMEGTNLAQPLNAIGVSVFVLKYRLAREEGSTYKVELEALADAQRAIRSVRARAQEWNLDPARIGIMGFSAGGELAALASTRYDAGNSSAADTVDQQSSRPNYQVLIYPGGLHVEHMKITRDTPPAFMLSADNDKGPSTAIANLYLAFKNAGVPAEVHIFLTGGHGFGLRQTPKPGHVVYQTWVARLQDWMSAAGMSTPK